MQRTLFDFARKSTSAAGTAAIAATGADSTSGKARKRTRQNSPTPPRSPKGLSAEHGGTVKGDSATVVDVEVQEDSCGSNSVVVAVAGPSAVLSDSTPRSPLQTSTQNSNNKTFQAIPATVVNASKDVEERQTAPATQRGKGGSAAPVMHSVGGLSSSTGGDSTSSSSTSSSRWLADLITAPEWKTFLRPITADTWRGGAFTRIERFLDDERAKGKVVLPPAPLIFNAFNSCPFADLKVVLIGQDPYHDVNQAHGLCFSVLPGVALPPSLRNMYKELATDIAGFQAPTHGYLQSWSEQGMLMLNATLTVEAHRANSHSKTSGWTHFTDAVIAHLSKHHPNRLVFLLWGNFAQQKKKLIDTSRHVVIENVHPSPLSASRGWFGCHCFSTCNAALRELGHLPLYWQLPLQVQKP